VDDSGRSAAMLRAPVSPKVCRHSRGELWLVPKESHIPSRGGVKIWSLSIFVMCEGSVSFKHSRYPFSKLIRKENRSSHYSDYFWCDYAGITREAGCFPYFSHRNTRSGVDRPGIDFDSVIGEWDKGATFPLCPVGESQQGLSPGFSLGQRTLIGLMTRVDFVG
jgi:hypothetical protein